ncbi:Pyocin activator protein PrtN [Burkholderia sp. MSMB1078WGS]|uniref:pyocin activator PrtN family protein n=1 Tax=Burkholderia sp. MSMB1078WGS TaxID=1637900 RepID=UPI0007524548|nr:pyocin activator PrtN family protein [Burkholderia sp. MSMB1078WGS]KVT04471.1 Pyocin activator protein PrtN [Burkholderia sp. MSMB1078WGS]
MNTVFMLMAQYGVRAIIPIEDVCRDFFEPLTLPNLMRKISSGEIALPVIRMERSQKCAKGVHITDLAAFIDKQLAAALKGYDQRRGRTDRV